METLYVTLGKVGGRENALYVTLGKVGGRENGYERTYVGTI